MNLKGMLKVSTSLMVCGVLFSSLAQAEDYVTKSQVNAANGVAGLDASKRVTADVNNDHIESKYVNITHKYELSDNNGSVDIPLLKLVPDSQSSTSLGREVVQFGGDYAKFPDPKLPLPQADEQKIWVPVPRSLSVIGRPYGNMNAGCTLCVFSTNDGMYGGGAQAAISGLDYHGTKDYNAAYAVANGDLVTVGFYQYDENANARVVAQAASFGPQEVTLASPMTDVQMSQLKEGMYIATNVIDPTIKPDNEKFLRFKTYWGFIKSWDATHIYVYDWAVQGSKNDTPNQVPNIKNLETKLLSYKVPMIFAGASNKIFSKNTYVNPDGSKVLGEHATSVANQFEREEFDFHARNWTKPNSLSFHGWTTSFSCGTGPKDGNCDPKAVSEDSYAYLVNGPNGLPRAYVAQMDGNGLEFSGYSTMIPGNGAPIHVGDNGEISDAIEGSNHIMSSFESGLSSNNKIHMSTIVNRDIVNTNTWRDYSVRLVMDVDGSRDRSKGIYNGSRKGSIVFNYKGDAHDGGVCILGFDENQGFCQEGSGNVNFAKDVTFNTGLTVNSGLLRLANKNNPNAVYLSTLYDYTDADKQAGKQDTRGDIFVGTQVAGGANIRGVNGYYGNSLTVSQQVKAPKFVGTLSTPSSSSASCTTGEFKDDANYHYVCVAANKWKRIALSDF